VLLLKKNNNSYDVLKQRKIKDKELKTNAISYANKSYLINTCDICYTKGIKHYIIIDVDESQLTLFKQKAIISAEMIDKILNKSIIAQFTSALNIGTKTEWGAYNYCIDCIVYWNIVRIFNRKHISI